MAEYEKGKHPNSLKNLLPCPPPGAQKKGAYASFKTKHKNKLIKDAVLYLLNLPINEGKPQELKNIVQARTKNLSVIDAIVVAQIKRAVSGDTKAYLALIDTIARKEFASEYAMTTLQNGDDKLLEALKERSLGFDLPGDVIYEEDEDAANI